MEGLVPKELVREMTVLQYTTKAGGRKKRRGLEVSGRLLKTLVAVGGAVSWEVLRKIALSSKASRELEVATTRSRKGPILHTKYQKRLRRLKAENDLLSRQCEQLHNKVRNLEWQLETEQRSYNQQRILYSKIIHQEKERRNIKTQTYAGEFVYETELLTKLLTELRHVKDLYMKQKLLTASICEKYVKVREGKEKLWRRLSKLEYYYNRAMEEALSDFDRDRTAFALVERDGRLRVKEQRELVIRCSTLAFNNAALHLALLKVRINRAKRAPNDLARDISMFSILKDTKNLARYEENMKKLEEEPYKVEDGTKKMQDKFIKLAVAVGKDLKEVPLFEMESEEDSRSEREEEEKETEGVEVDSSMYSRSEESRELWRRQQSSSDLGYNSGSRESRPPARSISSHLDTLLDAKKVFRSESAIEIKKPSQRNESAPDIIQAVPSGFRSK